MPLTKFPPIAMDVAREPRIRFLSKLSFQGLERVVIHICQRSDILVPHLIVDMETDLITLDNEAW